MIRDHPHERVFGLYPCQTGFAFAVIERRRGLVDWGEAELGRDTDEEFIARVALEIERCSPSTVALEDCSYTRRGPKAQRRSQAIRAISKRLGVKARVISRVQIRDALALATNATKNDVAERLCHLHPELKRQTPRRSIWGKDPRMNLFDAVALATSACRPSATGR